MFILFFIITMSAGFMLQSVTREKENRTAETPAHEPLAARADAR